MTNIMAQFQCEATIGSSPWLVGGDFNAIACLFGRSHGHVITGPRLSMDDFSMFLVQSYLREIPVSGGTFAWIANRHCGRVWRKMDRFLFNTSWLQHFPTSLVHLMSRVTSDHNPLLLSPLPAESLPRQFCFQTMWLWEPDFEEVVKNNGDIPCDVFGMQRFSIKLRRLKLFLKDWNKNRVGNIFTRLKANEDRLKQLELRYEYSGAEDDLVLLNQAQEDYVKSQAIEEDYWKQKANLKWLADGDRNTAFHVSVAAKRSKLIITKLKNNA